MPVYNELQTIERIIKKVRNQELKDIEIIVVDDFSTDGTRKVIKDKLFKYVDKVIYHKKNKGKGAAIKSAQMFISGDVVIIQDADLEYDPNDYKHLVSPIFLGKTKVVYGSRVVKNNRYNSTSFTSLNRIFFNH